MAVMVAGCDGAVPDASQTQANERTTERKLKRACGSAQAFDQLKLLAFEQAAGARGAPAPTLTRLAAESVVRMEAPAAKNYDPTLDIVTCTGRLVLELPPGAEAAFGGARRLEADVEYTAQEAADGSGLIYRMRGAEPIVRRLAVVGQQPRQEPVATRTPASRAPAQAPSDSRTETAASPRTTSERSEAPRSAPRVARDPAIEGVAVSSPSFNCAYARSRVERMICSSERLAEHDRAMSSVFHTALADADRQTRALLQSSRDRFLAFRDGCRNEACIAQAYEDRIAEIRDIADGRY